MTVKRCKNCNAMFDTDMFEDNKETDFCCTDCENGVPREIKPDPIVQFLAGIQFNMDIFVELEKAAADPEVMAKFFQTPDVLALHHLASQFDIYDPNKNGPGEVDHKAMVTLLKWFIIRYTNDPVWFCYVGWLMRSLAVYATPNSYYPIRTSPRFYLDNFIIRGQPINFADENANIKKPEEIFKRKKQDLIEKKVEELAKQKLEEKVDISE